MPLCTFFKETVFPKTKTLRSDSDKRYLETSFTPLSDEGRDKCSENKVHSGRLKSHWFKDIEIADIWSRSPLKQPERICLSIKLLGGVCCQVFWDKQEVVVLLRREFKHLTRFAF